MATLVYTSFLIAFSSLVCSSLTVSLDTTETHTCQVGQERNGEADLVWVLPDHTPCDCDVIEPGGVNLMPNLGSPHTSIYVDTPLFSDDIGLIRNHYGVTCSSEDSIRSGKIRRFRSGSNMAKRGSGKEYIEHDAKIVANIGEHFNKEDISDVTLVVGKQVFAAHRFVLASQSKVFMTMLMDEKWRESEEKKITLEETTEGEAVFFDFLKFFYTGKLTLTIDNVCAIHAISDKYDVGVLKDDCVSFMKDVLTGVHGDALWAALQWLQFAESFLSSGIIALCYSAIRTNFAQVCLSHDKHYTAFVSLSNDQVKKVLSVSGVEEELVLFCEDNLLRVVDNKTQFLPFVRFYNIAVDVLETCNKNKCKKYLNEAYKIHAEKTNIAMRACKRRRTSLDEAKLTCPCDTSSSQVCPHVNPRLYLCRPFNVQVCKFAGQMEKVPLCLEPDDLSDMEGFLQKQCSELYGQGDPKLWRIKLQKVYSGDPIYETFTVTPHKSHVGRRFTLAIVCSKVATGVKQQYVFAIKHTGEVTVRGSQVNMLTFVSPLRFKGSWELQKYHQINATILLHK